MFSRSMIAARPPHDAACSGFPDVEVPQAACVRLLCAGPWRPDGSGVQALLQGRRDWLARHAATGVRAALLHAPGWLLRWFEGTPEAVEAEWQRLRADADAPGLQVLHCSEGRAGLGPPVQVLSLHSGESPLAFALRLQAIERASGWRPQPLELWQALAAPAVPGGPGAPGLAARRDLVVLGSEDNEAVEAVRLLAQGSGDRLVYQRYAGSEPERGEVGAAYLDVARQPSPLTRVHALPRRVPESGIALLGVRDVRCVVLLLGDHAQRGRVAVLEALRLVAERPEPPAVVLATRCPYVGDAALAAFAQFEGLSVSHTHLASPLRASAALLAQLLESVSGGGPWSLTPAG